MVSSLYLIVILLTTSRGRQYKKGKGDAKVKFLIILEAFGGSPISEKSIEY